MFLFGLGWKVPGLQLPCPDQLFDLWCLPLLQNLVDLFVYALNLVVSY